MKNQKTYEELLCEQREATLEIKTLKTLYEKEKADRLRVETDFTAYKNRLEIVMKASSFAWWEMNIITGEVTFSDRKTDMLGYSASDFRHYEDFMAIVHPDDRDKVMKEMQNHLGGNSEHYEVSYRILSSSGEYKTFYDFGKIIHRDSAGKPVITSGIVKDITERTTLYDNLIKSERALRKAEEIAKLGSWQLYLNEKLMKSSEGASRVYGFQLTENSLEDVRKRALPSYRTMLDKAFSDLINTGKPYNVEFKIQRESDGKVIDVHSVAEYDPDKKIMLGTIQDITERKSVEDALRESEEKFRLIIENTSNAILFTEPSGTINFANPAACKLFGLSNEEFQNLGRSGITDPNDPRVASAVEERKKTGSFKGELSFKKKDGTIFPVEMISNAFVDSKGIERTGIIINDISERKIVEEKIMRQNQELQKLNSDKDHYMAVLAHDLKSPFNSLLGFSQLLHENIREYDIDKIEKQVDIINQSANNLYTLLDDLLLWTMSQSSKFSFEPQTLKLKDFVCTDVINSLNSSANSKNIAMSCIGNPEHNVFADAEMLKIILRNLVSNAIKFTNPGGNIAISTEQSQVDLTITVADNGIGIPSEALEKLFDISHIFSTKGTSNERGTGLGLVLCKEFTEKHGGKIWVESIFGQGSEFKFTLPFPKSNPA
jgi:PAS domain S-box-containing protein